MNTPSKGAMLAANASLRYLGYPSTHFIALDIAPIIEEHTSTAELLAALTDVLGLLENITASGQAPLHWTDQINQQRRSMALLLAKIEENT